ncbi:GNAT family N-acetyltransferase [Candidatus Micrarchaeota archaeon]|nr:GNAT family N-acetyltransferase [Candidatus Micrarchaeota archaeon]
MKRLIGEKVVLRPLVKKDLPNFVEWLNDPEIAIFLESRRRLTMKDELQWLESTHREVKKRKKVLFAIADRRSGQTIGNCELRNINALDKTAELAILIGDKNYWGKGFGSKAIKLLLEFGFSKLNLHRIWLTVHAFNKRARKAYEKAGFRKEGVLREHVLKEGKYFDSILMGLLSREFQ